MTQKSAAQPITLHKRWSPLGTAGGRISPVFNGEPRVWGRGVEEVNPEQK